MRLSVVVVGQVARDLVLEVTELPGPSGSATVRARREMLGGKGANQAVSFAQLGVPVALVGVVGADLVGGALLRQIRADRIETAWVIRRREGTTALVVDVVDGSHKWRYLEDFPPSTLLDVPDLRRVEGAFAGRGAAVLQLQQPGAAMLAAARQASAAGCRIVLDGAPEERWRAELLATADVVRADAREAELLTGVAIDGVESALRAGAAVLDQGRGEGLGRHGPRPSLAVLAAGQDGNVLVWRGGSAVIPLVDAPVRDQTGAGDAFVAALVSELLRGQDAVAAGRMASVAAASTVGRLGGRPALSRAALSRWRAQVGESGRVAGGHPYRWADVAADSS
jgi:ribokinase